KKLLNMV
ncbi:RHS Repeat family protein, partial [Vibrio parahaemolyticus VP2007-007]